MCGEGCGQAGQAGQAGQREPRFHLPAFGQDLGEGREEGAGSGGTSWVLGDHLALRHGPLQQTVAPAMVPQPSTLY